MSVAYFKYKNSILSFPKPKLYPCFWLDLNYTSKKYYNSMHSDDIKNILSNSQTNYMEYTRGADNSLARPTSQCRRTESTVPWKERSVHVSNCKSFLVTEAERKHVRRREMETRAVIKFFLCKARGRRKFTPFWEKHAPSYATVKTKWSSLNVVIFHLCCASSWKTQNSDHPGNYW